MKTSSNNTIKTLGESVGVGECAGEDAAPATQLQGLIRTTLGALLMTALIGCTIPPQLDMRKDSAPDVAVDPAGIVDAVPREELITRSGNKNPYTVLGKTYHLLPTGEGYKAQGIGSWYGTKFHGRPTANGERYSLYGMTAAHRTLPIPTYVKVTNLENNRTAIVRVNDRGPFHQDRIIDLSYAAAVKLGYAEKGTARLQVEVIDTRAAPVPEVLAAQNNNRYFLQVAAFKSLALANKMRMDLLSVTTHDVVIKPSEEEGYYRVQIGPLSQIRQVQQVSGQLLELNFEQPRLISE